MTKNQPDKPLQIDAKDALDLGRCMHKIAHALNGAMFTRAEALALFGFLDGMMYMLMEEHKVDLRHLETWVDSYAGQYERFIKDDASSCEED